MASQGGTESACPEWCGVSGFISSDPHPTGGALRSRLLISYSRCVHGGEPPGDGDGSGEPCLSGDRRRSRWAVRRGMQIEVEMSGMGTRRRRVTQRDPTELMRAGLSNGLPRR